VNAVLQSAILFGLALVGWIVALRMQLKAVAARRGMLTEPSVVQTARARVAGPPNSAIGLAYYSLMMLASPWIHLPAVYSASVVATLAAAGFSMYLAYSLLYVTRMSCVLCWTGHVVNWALLFVLIAARFVGR